MPIPIITNTTDDPTITTDDAANLPPSSIYPCTPFNVDVRGPGFTTGDITWSVLNSSNAAVAGAVTAGQNTIQATISFPSGTAPGTYTIKAALTSNTSDSRTQTITLVANPPITVSTPNQPIVGGSTQFATAQTGGVWGGDGDIDTTTGLVDSWTTAGAKTITYTRGGCVTSYSYEVFAGLAVTEYDGDNCIYLSSGGTTPLTVTGGSGTYTYTITGQNSVSSTGVVTAGLYAGEYRVTIIDTEAGIIQNVPICIGSQTQFCVAVEQTACVDQESDPCCELSVDSGETVSLKVPTFHMRVNGTQQDVKYVSNSSGTTGEGGYFKSGAGAADATGNAVNCDVNETLFEIVTSVDMADLANTAFGIGFGQSNGTSGIAGIDTAAVWFTSAGVRYVELRQEGVAVADTRFAVAQGDIVSAGYTAGGFVLYINNLLKATLADVFCFGNQSLKVAITQANKAIGGNLGGLTWTIVTAGSPSEVGTINENGVYAAPVNAQFSLVQAEATIGNAKFRVNIRNIRPTIRDNDPNTLLSGKAVTLWVGPYIPGFNEPIRLAKDGSPDYLQNTYKGQEMIDLGTLEGSANFQYTPEFQDFTNDLGVYQTSVVSEGATIAAAFLEVRNFHKMNLLVSGSTLYSKKNGSTEFGVGGNNCGVKELRVIMVIGNPSCGDEFDVLYLPRVQNKGTLGLEVGRRTASKYDMTLTALQDFTRTPGKQLFSIFHIDSCSNTSCTV